MGIRVALRIVAAGFLAAAAQAAQARKLMDTTEALRVAFGPDATTRRETVFLTDDELARARQLAGDGIEIPGALVTRYVGIAGGKELGVAYFDTHRVRTLPETLMVVVAPDGGVRRVEVLAFGEPEDYLPRRNWLDQFAGRRLDRELLLSRGIHGITGATLTARSATEAVRRVLALHAVVVPVEAGPR